MLRVTSSLRFTASNSSSAYSLAVSPTGFPFRVTVREFLLIDRSPMLMTVCGLTPDRRTNARSRAPNSESANGLTRQSSAPASSPFTRSAGSSLDVNSSTGADLLLRRRSAKTLQPSLSGSVTSITITSYSEVTACRVRSLNESVVSTACPSPRRYEQATRSDPS